MVECRISLPPDYSQLLSVLSRRLFPLVSMRDWRETSFGKCRDYFRSISGGNTLNVLYFATVRHSFMQYMLLFNKTSLLVCWHSIFYVSATPRKDLISQTRVDTSAQFSDVSSPPAPPSWKWSSTKADVHQLLREIKSVDISTWSVSIKTEHSLCLGAFTAQYSDTLAEQRCTALFSSVVLDLKLANGCSTASRK